MSELCSSVVEIWSIIRIFEMCICDKLQSALVLNSSSSIPNGDEGGEKSCVTYYASFAFWNANIFYLNSHTGAALCCCCLVHCKKAKTTSLPKLKPKIKYGAVDLKYP